MHGDLKFCIVSRIEYIDNEATFTQIGYIGDTTTLSDTTNLVNSWVCISVEIKYMED
jgi:hypothetical protein